MKYFFNGMGWLGIGLGMVALVAALAFIANYDLAAFQIPAGVWKNPPFEFMGAPPQLLFFAFGTGLIGIILSALGVLGVKSAPFLWISWLGFGIAYCVLVSSGVVYETAMRPSLDHLTPLAFLVIFLLPGIIGIIIGLMIRPRRAVT